MSKVYTPGYINLYKTGELNNRIERLYEILKECKLCPRKCSVDRTKKNSGYCKSGLDILVSSSGPHFGEEPELVGDHGSGTIFLTNCNLGCVYCQNYDISHLGIGKIMSVEELADTMIGLQSLGCHNINFVTPTHFVPQLVMSIKKAYEKGLRIPIVYNCGGYENVEIIKLLNGIIDIYMPDIKYGINEYAKKYSNAENYFDICKDCVKEMYSQVGDLKSVDGIAQKGLIIRHLVLPNNIAGSEKVIKFIAEEISKDTYINIMDQYRPCFNADKYPEINRRINLTEYNKVLELAKSYGLYRGF